MNAVQDLDTTDYVVGGAWGLKGADRYLLDQVRDRLGFPETVAAIKKMSAKWPKAATKLVESCNIYLPHPAIAPWVETFIDECSSFPNGKYDDQVDQMTQVLNWLRNAVPPPKKYVPGNLPERQARRIPRNSRRLPHLPRLTRQVTTKS